LTEKELAGAFMGELMLMRTVLVIENDRANRENILRILRFKSFRGIAAENGEMGIEIAKKYLPDLILCDISMPELDGYGVLETLRRFPATQNIPVVFITAKAAPADVQHAMSLGVDGYLTKPFGCDELVEAMATGLSRSLDRQSALSLKTIPKAVAIDSAREYPSHKC
jgi:CheY-like chemotaxis protein